ncbi:MAG: 2-oxoisovalerate dehydrogenase [Gammaproteobacteria bacterium]|nr:2-oxoisovalerate dehydrogenase [Gammaproteobacteria bacterium]MDE0256760.1 2-oxoisovalerate dehydrogenase [Gammaproteobacteria bacterium]
MDYNEIIFEVADAPEGGYEARALGHGFFTQGEDWEDLKEMVRDAVRCHFAVDVVPGVIRLDYVRDEAIAV